MQIQPTSELAYVQATMTMDAMRTELLLYRAEIEKLKSEIARLQEQLKGTQDAIKSTDI